MIEICDGVRFDEIIEDLAYLKMRAVDFESRYEINLSRYYEDGLGTAIGGVLGTSSGLRFIVQELTEIRTPRLCIQIPRSNLDEDSLHEILDELKMARHDCYWTILDGYDAIPHTVYREDDNGNRFTVADFDSKIEAELRMEELEAGHHKQHFWTSPTNR